MTQPLYRIAKWTETFERAESRKLKALTWVSVPIRFSSSGYQSMLDEFDDDAPAVYGAWCALVAIAAGCHVRGVLGTSRGIPLKTSHIARLTGFQSAIFDRLIAWASRPDVAWLETVPSDQVAALMQETQEKQRSEVQSGESPDDPPTPRGIPPHTGQDITGPNKTGPNKTNAAACFAAAAKEFLDLQEVDRLCRELLRVKPTLDRAFVFRVCCVGAALERGIVDDWIDRLRAGEIKRPKRWLEAAIDGECRKQGFTWAEISPLVKVPVCRPGLQARPA